MRNCTMEQMYQKYRTDIIRYAYYLCKDYYTAEDLAQETFCKAWKHLNFVDPEGKQTKSWLIRVTYNTYIDKLRKDSRLSTYDNEYFSQYADEETPESSLLEGETRRELYDQLSRLQPNQQHAVLLYDVHGFSYQESADLLGISLSNFKIILYRARQKLRDTRRTA